MRTEMKSQEIQEIVSPREKEEPNTAPFRFNDLPTELQLIIIRQAIPQHGLLPFASLRLGYLDDWNYPNSIPTSLFRVNKMISAEAQAIVQEKVYLVIDVSQDFTRSHRSTISFLKTQLLSVRELPSHLAFANVGHFEKLRNFELDLMTEQVRPWALIEAGSRQYKERFRLIGDILSTFNHNIQHLTITLPCLCGIDTPESVQTAEACLLNFLAPLRRLRVAKPIAFRVEHIQNEPFDNPIVHDDFRTEHLLHMLKEHFGRLTGEELSGLEAVWRNLKAEDRTQLHAASIEVEKTLCMLWYVLDKTPTAFQRCATRIQASWSRKLLELAVLNSIGGNEGSGE
ncbi:MAG: hypothetical protein LQ344_005908 [Seirophora lacunosa]|nr:MAG: hypothetical protein LQ344_005908 [Seirophora lacunosa]